MIRKQVVFKANKEVKLKYAYNHDVMKNIYYYIQTADEVLGRRLHNEGFRSETGHIYKLFNYTLLFEKARFKHNGIYCNENTVIKLILSGQKDIIDRAIKGIMHIKKCRIGNIDLKLEDIRNDKKVFWKDITLYSALTGVVVCTKDDRGQVVYLTPYIGKYYRNLAENAKRKYKIIYGEEYTGVLFFDIDDALNIKEKYIEIKDGGVRGYKFDIWIECSKKMQKIIYYLGLGQNSSTGAGCLNFVTGVDANE